MSELNRMLTASELADGLNDYGRRMKYAGRGLMVFGPTFGAAGALGGPGGLAASVPLGTIFTAAGYEGADKGIAYQNTADMIRRQGADVSGSHRMAETLSDASMLTGLPSPHINRGFK